MRDVRAELLQKPMNGFQVFAIAVMVFLNAMDGFDVLAMAFAGPILLSAWGIDRAMLGWLMSAGLVGMMAGSLFIAPFADTLGRKKLILVALFLDTLGLFMSAFANSFWELAFWRLITGLGIGAMLASVASMTAEYASARHRSLCVSIMAIGYPAGATLGGFAVAALVAAFDGDWRVIFLFGAACSFIALPMILILPDSLEFLVERRPKNALQKINSLLPKLGMAKIDALPALVQAQQDNSQLFRTLIANHGRSLFLITAAYFLFAATLYFPLQWMPVMLTEAGLSPEMGISGSALMNGAGVFGGILFGIIAARWGGLRNTIPAFMVLSVVAIVAFGFLSDLALMLVLGGIIGFALIGTVSGLYSTYPVIFPPAVRTTGAGFVIGVGRIGGIISPVAVGYMIDAGTPRPLYCFLLALPLVFAIFLLRAIRELKSPLARGDVGKDAAQ